MFKKILYIIAIVFAAAIGVAQADYTIDSVTIESQESVKMGSAVAVTARAQSTSPNLRLNLEVPEGLQIVGSSTQELGTNRVYTWNVIGRNSGFYVMSIYATDGTSVKSASKSLKVIFNHLTVTSYPSKYSMKPGESFTITGNVKDIEKIAVKSALIEVKIGGKRFTTNTNDNGDYSISVIAGQVYDNTVIVTAKKDYMTQSTSSQIQVTENPSTVCITCGGGGSGDITSRKKITINVLDSSRNKIDSNEMCANSICVHGKQTHTFEVSQSTAYIEIRKIGYQTQRLDLQIVDGAIHTIMLEKLSGDGFAEIVVRSFDTDEILNAKVIIASGSSYIIKGNIRIVLPAGQHGIIVEAEGYTKDYRIVNVQPGTTSLVAFSVKKSTTQDAAPQNKASSTVKDTATAIGIWVLWISAIVSILALVASFYWHYFRNPLKETESF